MSKKVFVIKSECDFARSFSVMRELRPHLSFDDYKRIYEQAQLTCGYQIVALEHDEQIVGLMGYRFLSDFVRGKHLYIDDLVSTHSARSQGIGAQLLQYAEDLARENDCRVLRLCTGIENERGVKFYERNGWEKRAFAYTKKSSRM